MSEIVVKLNSSYYWKLYVKGPEVCVAAQLSLKEIQLNETVTLILILILMQNQIQKTKRTQLFGTHSGTWQGRNVLEKNSGQGLHSDA